MATCQKIIKTIERLAPSALAEEWDNTGLQVGDPGREINLRIISLVIWDGLMYNFYEDVT